MNMKKKIVASVGADTLEMIQDETDRARDSVRERSERMDIANGHVVEALCRLAYLHTSPSERTAQVLLVVKEARSQQVVNGKKSADARHAKKSLRT